MNKTKKELLTDLKNIVEELIKREPEMLSNVDIINIEKEKLIKQFFKTVINFSYLLYDNLDVTRHFSSYQQVIKDFGVKSINIKNFITYIAKCLKERDDFESSYYFQWKDDLPLFRRFLEQQLELLDEKLIELENK